MQLKQAVLEHFTSGRILAAVLILLAALLLLRWLSRLFEILSRRAPRSRFFVRWMEPVTRIAVWFVAVFASVSLLAPSRETFLAALASVGIALGLGAQDLVKNIIGGLYVVGDRPYQLGDRVRIGDAYGEIDHIGLQSTKLTTPEDTRVTIPNAAILTGQVFNSNSGVPDCQVVTDLYLPPDADPVLARSIGEHAAWCSPFLLHRKPVVVLVAHGFDQQPHMKLRIKCYIFDHRFEPQMQSDITTRAMTELLEAGVLQRWNRQAVAAS